MPAPVFLPVRRTDASSAPALPAAMPSARPGCVVPFGPAHLQPMPDGSLFEPDTRTLFAADVHVGKAEAFRRLGVPVPGATSDASLARLTAAMARCRPRRLIVLGDLLHARLPDAHPVHEALARWRYRHKAVSVELVVGNHDRKTGDVSARCGIATYAGDGPQGLQLCHEPDERDTGRFALCGHLHPVLHLRGRADSLRLRCFWFQPQLAVLPAFGAFTGGHPIQAALTDRLYAIDGEMVHALPTGFQTARRVSRGPAGPRSGGATR